MLAASVGSAPILRSTRPVLDITSAIRSCAISISAISPSTIINFIYIVFMVVFMLFKSLFASLHPVILIPIVMNHTWSTWSSCKPYPVNLVNPTCSILPSQPFNLVNHTWSNLSTWSTWSTIPGQLRWRRTPDSPKLCSPSLQPRQTRLRFWHH